ncbi:MAG TPA: glycerophosphodiester phosphodiesterase [Gemmatimonadales bacterium]|jgi:glycerophosphoryl diester phosphodiesterase
MAVPRVIAHRGASSDETENSLAAFRAAVRQGADGIELDVHAAADGTIVVYHDAEIDGRALAELTADDVRSFRLPNDEPIPTLGQALDTIGRDTDVFVELKALALHHTGVFLDVLRAGPAPQRYRVHSFDHRVVARLHREQPALGVGVLSCSYPVNPVAQIEAADAQVLWQKAGMIDASLVDSVHAAGYRVFAWTVDDARRLRQLARLGVDALCTNRPAHAREVLG